MERRQFCSQLQEYQSKTAQKLSKMVIASKFFKNYPITAKIFKKNDKKKTKKKIIVIEINQKYAKKGQFFINLQ